MNIRGAVLIGHFLTGREGGALPPLGAETRLKIKAYTFPGGGLGPHSPPPWIRLSRPLYTPPLLRSFPSLINTLSFPFYLAPPSFIFCRSSFVEPLPRA